MTANFQQELDRIVERRSQATQLDTLIQGYRLCARTEGKSENTITITTTALTKLNRFMDKYLPMWKSYKAELNRSPLSHQDWSY